MLSMKLAYRLLKVLAIIFHILPLLIYFECTLPIVHEIYFEYFLYIELHHGRSSLLKTKFSKKMSHNIGKKNLN